MASPGPSDRPERIRQRKILNETRDDGPTAVIKGLDLRILGARTTSGLNRLDFALVRYRQDLPDTPLSVELLKHSEVEVPSSIRNPILNLLREAHSKTTLATHINAQIGQMFSDGINTFCQRHNIEITSINFVGTHVPSLGRFVPHPTNKANGNLFGWTSVIQANTRLTTIFGFTIAERAVVRPNISPVAFVDRLFLRHPDKLRACLSIDEIANISFIPAYTEDDTRGTMSFSCGPGSLFIDYAMRYCTSKDTSQDNDGKFAANGVVNQSIVDRFLDAYNYLRVAPPLHITREMFGDHEAQRFIDECLFANMSEADTVATITRATAQNILKQYGVLLEHLFPKGQKVDELFICGPSAKNSNIVDYLEAELPESVITRPMDDVGISGEAHEAVCYAHLALEAVLGQATQSLDSETPATRPQADEAVKAMIACGENWESLLEQLRSFSRGKPLRVTKNVKIVGNAAAGLELWMRDTAL